MVIIFELSLFVYSFVSLFHQFIFVRQDVPGLSTTKERTDSAVLAGWRVYALVLKHPKAAI